MKLSELIALEDETVAGLRARAQGGDNDAAHVLLDHLRKTSAAIRAWQESQPKRRKAEEPPEQ